MTPSPEPHRRRDLDRAAAIRRTLARSTDPDARVLRLRHLEQLSFEEIAQRLGEPLASVRGRYYRALKRLQSELGENEEPSA